MILVDLVVAYLNPADQIEELRRTLARLAAPDALADDAALGAATSRRITMANQRPTCDPSGSPSLDARPGVAGGSTRGPS
jgi:hypothetical protein